MTVRFLSSFVIATLLLLLPAGGLASSRGERAVCSRPSATRAACFARVLTSSSGVVVPDAAPEGYSPSQLRSAYRVSGAGSTSTVAVVDAYGDSRAKSDLDVYSKTFNLPVLPSCASLSQRSCFEKLDQTGGHSYPANNSGWALETALDIEAVHAICPDCRLELIQAKTASMASLMAAVDTAVATGADVVSMSWGGTESSSETREDAHFNLPRVVFTASSGDSGYGTSYPAASSHVLAVGGTHLHSSSTGRWTETAWAGSGSGCSSVEPKPNWQHDRSCSNRTIADLAADADPATGAAVYSSLSPSGKGGWFVVGGTSLAAPLVAAAVALAAPASQVSAISELYSAQGTSALHDVTSGTTGSCGTYLCQARSGYDGPTGVGAPRGLSAF